MHHSDLVIFCACPGVLATVKKKQNKADSLASFNFLGCQSRVLKCLWLPCWTSWGDRLRSKLTRTAWPSLVQEGRICSSVFFLLACSLLPSLTAPIRFFISFIVKSLHVGLACTNWNPQYTRWCLLGWAMLSLFCSRVCSHFPAAHSHFPSLSVSLSLSLPVLSVPVVALHDTRRCFCCSRERTQLSARCRQGRPRG